MKNIVLIGMPGCGKTTIGKILSQELGMEYCGIDEYIEARRSKTITEIFKDGEESFRQIEREAVLEVSKGKNTVIATGGGVIKSFENIENLRKNGIIIFLNRPVENIMMDVDIITRPLLKDGPDKLYTLFKERYSLYKEYSHYEVMNVGDIHQVVEDIVEIVKYKS